MPAGEGGGGTWSCSFRLSAGVVVPAADLGKFVEHVFVLSTPEVQVAALIQKGLQAVYPCGTDRGVNCGGDPAREWAFPVT